MVKEKKLNQQLDKITYLTIFFEFLKLGCTSFGGPIAHIGFFREHFAVAEKALKNWPFSQCLTCPFCTAKRTIREERLSKGQTCVNYYLQSCTSSLFL